MEQGITDTDHGRIIVPNDMPVPGTDDWEVSPPLWIVDMAEFLPFFDDITRCMRPQEQSRCLCSDPGGLPDGFYFSQRLRSV